MGGNWAITIFTPTLAVIINNIMWLSPLMVLLEARKKNDLGTLNPIPFAVTVFNCTGWVIYAVMISNYYILFANAPGLILGIYFVMTSLQVLVKPEPCEKEKLQRSRIEMIVIGGLSVWLIAVLFTSVVYKGSPKSTSFIGGLADAGALMYFAAPLSTIVQVFRTGDASTLYAPTILANFANATLWFFYGVIGLDNLNVYIPNGVAMALTIFQLFTLFIYRNSTKDAIKQPLAADRVSGNISINALHDDSNGVAKTGV
jgi:solute carrier family 50 protein (sugar transporter)